LYRPAFPTRRSSDLVTIHPIVIAGDPVLHEPTVPVQDFDDDLRKLVSDMFETMYAAEGVGLAANQIGVSARLFVYDCPDDHGVRDRKSTRLNSSHVS